PGALDAILAVDGEVTISHCFRFLDKDVAEKIIRDTERHNLNLSVPLFSRISSALMNQEPTRINSGRLQLAEDAQDALASLTRGDAERAYADHAPAQEPGLPGHRRRDARAVVLRRHAAGPMGSICEVGKRQLCECSRPGAAQHRAPGFRQVLIPDRKARAGLI